MEKWPEEYPDPDEKKKILETLTPVRIKSIYNQTKEFLQWMLELLKK